MLSDKAFLKKLANFDKENVNLKDALVALEFIKDLSEA
jgi:hypothetical protein